MLKNFLLFLVFSTFLFSCTKNENKNILPKETVVSNTGGAADKVPDPNVPKLVTVSLYHPNKDNTGIIKELEGIDTLDAELLFLSLLEFNFLPENCTINSFNNNSGVGNLDLSNFNINDTRSLICLKNTFIENFELNTLTISIDGNANTLTKDLKFESNYKDIK